MSRPPHTKLPESSPALLWNGYDFISKTCDHLKSDIFETRLLLKSFYCMRGEKAAELFYSPDLFERHGVMPMRVQNTLLGRKGVQSLDGEAHRHRKQLFLSLLRPEMVESLINEMVRQWQEYAARWEKRERIILFHEMEETLCKGVCAWSGIVLYSDKEVKLRARDFGAMIDAAGGIGPRFWRGRTGRIRTELWAESLIKEVRKSTMPPKENVLSSIAHFKDLNGKLLSLHIAAVELLNVLRPTIAVARYITFAAVALHTWPEYHEKIRHEGNEYLEMFVQEVRRFFPFFPFIAARVHKSFDWQNHQFPHGKYVMLDLYGTDQDQRIWNQPETFSPERFRSWNKSPYNFIPQGGGNHFENHRCPGELATIEIMKAAVRFLTTALEYRVPTQDLRISHRRIPAIPKSGFVMSCIKLK